MIKSENDLDNVTLDVINQWSEIKLEIIREYASAYSRIISAQKKVTIKHIYIDAFAGAGVHISKNTGDFVLGSPLNALSIKPPFKEFFLIDMEGSRTNLLNKLIGERKDVHVLEGDCNTRILEEVFPKVKYEDYRRGLCLLDPYGMQLIGKLSKLLEKCAQ
jgi:three-Cys-motif partner protein